MMEVYLLMQVSYDDGVLHTQSTSGSSKISKMKDSLLGHPTFTSWKGEEHDPPQGPPVYMQMAVY